MRTFSVLFSKSGSVPTGLLKRARLVGDATVLHDGNSVEWRNDRCALIVWDNDPPLPGKAQRGPIVSPAGNAMVIAGYWYSDDYLTEEALAESLLLAEEPKKIIERIHGAYLIFMYRARDASIHFFNTPSCQPVLFFTERKDIFMASTRGVSIPLVLDKRVEYDPMSFAGYINTGYFVGDRIPYKNVQLLECNLHLHVDSGGVRIAAIDSTMADLGLGEGDLTEEFLDEFCHRAVTLAKKLGSVEGEKSIGLSGGRDSRMVLAVLWAAGVPFRATTNGWSDGPDMVLATKLAEALDVQHHRILVDREKEIADRYDVTQLNAFRQQMYELDCLYFYPMVRPASTPVWAKRASPMTQPIIFAGTGAEMLRGGVGIRSRAPLRGVGDPPAGFAESFVRKEWLAWQHWIREPFASAHRDWVEGWISQYCRDQNEDGTLERLYLHNWASRGRGAITRNLSSNCGYVVNLMTDSGFIKLSQKLAPKFRYNEHLFFEVIRRLAPPIADVPLNDHRWAFEFHGPRPADEVGYKKRAPMIKKKYGASGGYTYLTAGADMRPVLEDVFFGQSMPSMIEDVADLKLIRSLFRGRDIYTPSISYTVWRILALHEMLMDDWISRFITYDNPVSVRHAVRWDHVALSMCDVVTASTSTPPASDSDISFQKLLRDNITELCRRHRLDDDSKRNMLESIQFNGTNLHEFLLEGDPPHATPKDIDQAIQEFFHVYEKSDHDAHAAHWHRQRQDVQG